MVSKTQQFFLAQSTPRQINYISKLGSISLRWVKASWNPKALSSIKNAEFHLMGMSWRTCLELTIERLSKYNANLDFHVSEPLIYFTHR
jgi:hypothetical protein